MGAIVISENVWANSQLSIVRHYGKIRFDGQEYIIVDKRGHDIYECSCEAARAGREKAIEPGEPADLVQLAFVPLYRKLGRERFLQFLEDNPDVFSVADAKARLKKWEQENPGKPGKVKQ